MINQSGIATASHAPAKRAITQEDIWLMRRVANPVVSPDGRFLAVPVTVPAYDPAQESGDIWIVTADGSVPPRCLTSGHGMKAAPAWSPDGSQLAFVTRTTQDSAAQIYVIPAAGGEARKITSQPAGARAPKWRPDGRALLFEATLAPPPSTGPVAAPRIYDAMPVRFWNRWLDEHRPHPFVLELSDGATPLDLLHGTSFAASPGFRGIFRTTERDTIETLQAQWSPTGQTVIFTAQVNADAMMHTAVFTSLFEVPTTGGEPMALTNVGESYSEPQFTRAGDKLYAIRKRWATDYVSTRLAQIAWPPSSGATILTSQWERVIEGYTLSPDGQTIYLDAADDGLQRVFRMPASGGMPEPVIDSQTGAWRALTPVEGGLVALHETALHPPELMRLGTPPTSLTCFNTDRLSQIDAPAPVHFRFTASNGKTIHNMLFHPPGFDPTRKYPIVTLIHGGPAAMSTDAFTYSAFWFHPHLLATPGYVVLVTNYTGSIGFGERFASDVEKDVLRGPAEEILEALDEAIRRCPYVDASRQAAVGGSYGGYFVNWLNGHTSRFKCLVAHVGPFNNEAQYGTNDGGFDREVRMGGPIWEEGGQWMDQSPLRYAQNFATPTLVTHGERDFRVPLGEGLANFKLLQRLNIPSRFIVFPDEGHMIGYGENARVFWREVSSWLARYL
jgi:dipeptidyl aminopeptidase/acylaminoacyl peptidase